jgi:limonene-1,2-epoxide hydrolase
MKPWFANSSAPGRGSMSKNCWTISPKNGWTSTDWEVLNLAVRGNIVIAERVDRTRLGAIAVDLPCCGVFEIEAGKIKVWRDYFDMATYTRAVEAG